MAQNRLHLDFGLETTKERTNFLNLYLQQEAFQKTPLTEDELETMGNYILWGKDFDGKNAVQKKEIQIKTKYGTWDAKEDESLDGLLENPSFNEANLSSITSTRLKVAREVFDRKKALKDAPASLKPIFEDLFYQIDQLDLTINYWDLAHNKRKNPPRDELLERFTEEEKLRLQEEATHWNQFKYLKKRHLLVELRRQQFTLKDSYSSIIQRHTMPIYEQDPGEIQFETEIDVFPLGVNSKDSNIAQLIFREDFNPENYTEEDLKVISNFLWEKKKKCAQPSDNFIIDFTNLEHVYNLLLLYFDLEDQAMKKELESETDSLLMTLEYYINAANLTKVQKEILKLKSKKIKNVDIADYINKKFDKTYSANYISTIFRQKIIHSINEAANFHLKTVSNLFFPENFKKCNTCKNYKLKDTYAYVKRARSADGYSNRCKCCDKKARGKI